jgi:hypothetical protein
VVAGLLDSGAEGIRQHDARWRSSVDQAANTVIATIGGESERVSFLDLARAAACAARVVTRGGRIAILSQAAPALGPGAEMLRHHDNPASAIKAVAKEKPADWAACHLWCRAAKIAGSLFLASGLPDTMVEELFATPIRNADEVQRLINASSHVLVIPDAHRSLVTL